LKQHASFLISERRMYVQPKIVRFSNLLLSFPPPIRNQRTTWQCPCPAVQNAQRPFLVNMHWSRASVPLVCFCIRVIALLSAFNASCSQMGICTYTRASRPHFHTVRHSSSFFGAKIVNYKRFYWEGLCANISCVRVLCILYLCTHSFAFMHKRTCSNKVQLWCWVKKSLQLFTVVQMENKEARSTNNVQVVFELRVRLVH